MGPYPEPEESSPRPRIPLSEHTFQYDPLVYTWVSQVDSCLLALPFLSSPHFEMIVSRFDATSPNRLILLSNLCQSLRVRVHCNDIHLYHSVTSFSHPSCIPSPPKHQLSERLSVPLAKVRSLNLGGHNKFICWGVSCVISVL